MPHDARDIEVTPTSTSSEPTDFTFHCSKQSILDLVKILKLETNEVPNLHFSSVGRSWIEANAKDAQYFFKVDGKGHGYLVATDKTMKRVLVSKQPFIAKAVE